MRGATVSGRQAFFVLMKHLISTVVCVCAVLAGFSQEDVTFQTYLTNTGGEPVPLTYTVATAGAIYTAADTTDASGFAWTTVNIPAGGFLQGQVTLSFLDCDSVETSATAFLMPMDSVGGGLIASFVADYCDNGNTGSGGGDPVVSDDCDIELLWASTDGMWFDFTATDFPAGSDLTWYVDGAVVNVTPDSIMNLGFDFTPAWAVCVSYESDSCGTVMDCVTSDEAWGGGNGGGDSLCVATFEVAQTLADDGTPVPGSVDLWVPEVDNNAMYFWDFGDEGTSNEATPTYTYTGNGPYLLCLTVSYLNSPLFPGCTATFCDTVSVDDSGMLEGIIAGFTVNVKVGEPAVVGVAERGNAANLSVHPNPAMAGHALTWTAVNTNFQPLTAEILDASGRILRGAQPVANGVIETAGVRPGLVFIRMQDAKGQVQTARVLLH